MKIHRLLPFAATVASLAASAQTARPVLAAADAAAQVAPLHYQSVFSAGAARSEEPASPDLLWVDANRQVADKSPGNGHAAHAATGQTPAPAPPAGQGNIKPMAPRDQPKHDAHHAPAKEK